MEKLPGLGSEELIKLGLEAVRKAEDVNVNGDNLDVLIVGENTPSKLLTKEEIDGYLGQIGGGMEVE